VESSQGKLSLAYFTFGDTSVFSRLFGLYVAVMKGFLVC